MNVHARSNAIRNPWSVPAWNTAIAIATPLAKPTCDVVFCLIIVTFRRKQFTDL